MLVSYTSENVHISNKSRSLLNEGNRELSVSLFQINSLLTAKAFDVAGGEDFRTGQSKPQNTVAVTIDLM